MVVKFMAILVALVLATGWTATANAGVRIQAEKSIEKSSPTVVASVATPKSGEIFELALMGDTDGLAMVWRSGIIALDWEYAGKGVDQPQKRNFKIIETDVGLPWDQVIRWHGTGKIPEGQWIEAFLLKYPHPDKKGAIGIADPSWVDPDGRREFPLAIEFAGRRTLDFRETNHDDLGLRWIVEVP